MRKYLFLIAALCIPALSYAASPGWITSCQYSHRNNDDMIVSPGQQGAAHTHEYVGSNETDYMTDEDDLLAGETTCLTQGDHSAYWVPALYLNGSSTPLPPQGTTKNALFYYRRKGITNTGGDVTTIPFGLRMILGNSHASSPSENEGISSGNIIFKCGPGSGTEFPYPPSSCPNQGILVISLRFPNCWDGENLDSADHISHMSYPVNKGNACPASHPVVLPRVESFWRYNIGTSTEIESLEFSSGPYYTIHQDFVNAWNPDDLQSLVDQCINDLVDCGQNPTP